MYNSLSCVEFVVDFVCDRVLRVESFNLLFFQDSICKDLAITRKTISLITLISVCILCSSEGETFICTSSINFLRDKTYDEYCFIVFCIKFT